MLFVLLPALSVCAIFAAFGSTAFGSGSGSPPATTEEPYLLTSSPKVGETIKVSEVGWSSAVQWVGLPEGKETAVTANGGRLSFSVSTGGVHFTVSCESHLTGAVLENPTGSGAPRGSAKLTLANCISDASGKTPAICKITPGPARTIYPGIGTGRSEDGYVEVNIFPQEGVVATFTASECTPAMSAFNGPWEVAGNMLGKYQEYGSQARFDPTTTGPALTMRGAAAAATWNLRFTNSSGVGIEAGPLGYSYSWKRCEGTSCEVIPGASSSTYVPTNRDQGKTLSAVITATNSAGSASVETNKSAAVE
jgi:hypothetical protein